MGGSPFLRSCVHTLMGKLSSNVQSVLARFLKALMVAVLVPLAIGLLLGIVEQLDLVSLSGATFRSWIESGCLTYVGLHVLLYRPVPLFRASHRLFSAIAVWLFGGQVSSVGGSGGGGGGKGKGGKGAKGDPASQGSPLVAFSPYVVPVYTILVCAVGWFLGRWCDRTLIDGPVSFFIGVTIAFQWLMTADDLQQQRERWHIETYLLAIGLVFLLTLLIGAACLPWAIPEFSFVRALAEGLSKTQAIYTTVIQRLFF